MFAGFSGHGNSVHNIIRRLKKENVHFVENFQFSFNSESSVKLFLSRILGSNFSLLFNSGEFR